MAPYGAALALIPKFNGTNISLADWVERLDSSARLFQIPTERLADLAINALEGEARRAVMVLPEKDRDSRTAIVLRLESLYGQSTPIAELRRRLYTRSQHDQETMSQYAVALQEIWCQLEKQMAPTGTGISNPDQLIRDQFLFGVRSSSIKRALRDRVRADDTVKFVDILQEAIEREQEELEHEQAIARSQVTTTHGVGWPLELKEGTAPCPSPNPAGVWSSIETIIKDLADSVTSLKQEISATRSGSSQPSATRNPLRRDPDTDRRCWQCGRLGHISRKCTKKGTQTVQQHPLN